jgi:hypothetical protein
VVARIRKQQQQQQFQASPYLADVHTIALAPLLAVVDVDAARWLALRVAVVGLAVL